MEKILTSEAVEKLIINCFFPEGIPQEEMLKTAIVVITKRINFEYVIWLRL